MSESEQLLGEDRDDARDELATTLVVKLSALEQALRLYELHNAMVTKTLEELEETTATFTQMTGQPMVLSLAGFSFFINRRLIRMNFTAYRKAEQLKRIWGRIGLGEIAFPEGITVVGLREFASQWLLAISEPEKAASFFARPGGGVAVRQHQSDDSPGEKVKLEEFLVRSYCALLVLARRSVIDVDDGRRPPILRIKRTMQVLVDHLGGYEGLLLALVRKPEYRADLAAHLANTAILGMIFGQALGLDRRQLVALGTAAIFHDLPKAGLNDRTLNSLEQPTAVSDVDRTRVGEHWLSRLQRFLEVAGLTDESLARAVVMYEAQLEFARKDLYPVKSELRLSLFSRILRLVDQLDTATWPRPGKETSTAHEAIKQIGGPGRTATLAMDRLLPTFVKHFGLYPTASTVRLRSGEIALVIEQNEQDVRQPVVKIVVDRSGNPVDGAEVNPSLSPDHEIVESVPIASLAINPVACFGISTG